MKNAKPAEPSPEVAPTQDTCKCDHSLAWHVDGGRCGYRFLACPCLQFAPRARAGDYVAGVIRPIKIQPGNTKYPAVAPRETQTELDEAIGKVYASEPYENLDDFRNAIVDALKLIAARLGGR